MRKCAGDRRMRVRIRPGGFTADTAVPPGSRGFTLVELVLSLAIMSIVLTGLASAIIIASHALPKDDSPTRTVVEAFKAADQIAEELRSALWIRERTATSVEFAVPDRDADGGAERIRYAWSGVAGEALTRQYNGGTVVNIADSVEEFDLGYDLQSVTEEYPGPVVEGSEVLLTSYFPMGAWSFTVDSQNWIGQYLPPPAPVLPPGSVYWELTRVRFLAQEVKPIAEQLLVQIRTAAGDHTPTDTILGQQVVLEADLSKDLEWIDVAFTGVSGLSPSQDVCLVLKQDGGAGPSAVTLYGNDPEHRITTSDGGSNWAYDSDKALLHYAYGIGAVVGPPQTATRTYVTGVRITLRIGSDPAGRVITTAQTLNVPELLAGMWETDFNTDPRLDRNGDGQPDWLDDAGTFTLASVVGGVWTDDSQLVTFPDNDFAALTTVKVRFRSIGVGGRAVFRIHADVSAGTKVILAARLRLEADGTQTFTFLRDTAPSTTIVVVSVPGLSSDLVDLRLVIDPDLNTVSVTVDGEHKGTHQYSTFVPPADKRFAKILGDGGTAEFDYVSVRVSE